MTQPIALLAPDLDMLFELVPELRGAAGGDRARAASRAVHARPPESGATLPLADGVDARRDRRPRPASFPSRPPRLVRRVSALAATSANLTGGPEPARLDDVPDELRTRVAVVVDGGELPGVPSTVIDFTGEEPRVLREGAVRATELTAR